MNAVQPNVSRVAVEATQSSSKGAAAGRRTAREVLRVEWSIAGAVVLLVSFAVAPGT